MGPWILHSFAKLSTEVASLGTGIPHTHTPRTPTHHTHTHTTHTHTKTHTHTPTNTHPHTHTHTHTHTHMHRHTDELSPCGSLSLAPSLPPLFSHRQEGLCHYIYIYISLSLSVSLSLSLCFYLSLRLSVSGYLPNLSLRLCFTSILQTCEQLEQYKSR